MTKTKGSSPRFAGQSQILDLSINTSFKSHDANLTAASVFFRSENREARTETAVSLFSTLYSRF